ncbi:hypothetical protein OEZ84_29135, partial [Leclercia adecarboxylata]|uniref:hypothetical protein n=1 Tax=Leclercia adecarboxylata TaxID=83655 RepID=UPI00234D168F
MNAALKLVHNANGRRNYINRLIQSEPREGVLFTDFISETIIRKSRRWGESYQNVYKTLIWHINEFSEKNEADIFTNSVGEEFMDDFICY